MEWQFFLAVFLMIFSIPFFLLSMIIKLVVKNILQNAICVCKRRYVYIAIDGKDFNNFKYFNFAI